VSADRQCALSNDRGHRFRCLSHSEYFGLCSLEALCTWRFRARSSVWSRAAFRSYSAWGRWPRLCSTSIWKRSSLIPFISMLVDPAAQVPVFHPKQRHLAADSHLLVAWQLPGVDLFGASNRVSCTLAALVDAADEQDCARPSQNPPPIPIQRIRNANRRTQPSAGTVIGLCR